MKTIAQSPFIRFLLPFILGIYSSYFYFDRLLPFLPFILTLWLMFLAFSIYVYFSAKYKSFGYAWLLGVPITGLLFWSGSLLTIVQNDHFQDQFYEKYFHQKKELLLLEVSEKPIEKENWIKVYCLVKGVAVKGKITEAYGHTLVYLKKDKASHFVDYGDRILVYGYFQKVQGATNPYGFDFVYYLGLSNIYHQAFINSGQWRYYDSKGGYRLKSISLKIADYILNTYRINGLGGQEFGVTAALVLGVRDELDSEVLSAFAASGAMHVLSVSGLHVGMIFAALGFLLKFMEKLKHGLILKSLLIILLLWFYALLTGLSPSVLRSTLMLTFMLVGVLLGRKAESLNVVCMSAFCLLLYDPYLLFNVGFQLSYAAVIGIVCWYRDLYNIFEFKFTIADWIWSLTCVSIVASLATLPISIYYFHQFPNYFLVSNYLVIPLSNAVIYLAISVAALSPFSTIAFWLTKALYYCVWLLNHSVMFIEKLPYAQIKGLNLTILHIFLLYLVILFLIQMLYSYRKRYLFITLSVFMVLVTFDLVQTGILATQKQVLIYSLGKTTALQFIDGQADILVSSKNLLENPKALKFNIEPVRIQKNIKYASNIEVIRDTVIKQISFFKKSGLIRFHNKNILILNQNIFVQKQAERTKLKIDVLVISNNARVNLKLLKAKIRLHEVVIDASNSFYQAKKLTEECNNLGITCYNLSESGAYILNVSQ